MSNQISPTVSNTIPVVASSLQVIVFSRNYNVLQAVSSQLVKFSSLSVITCDTAIGCLKSLKEGGSNIIVAIADVNSSDAETEIIFKTLADRYVPTLLIYDDKKDCPRIRHSNIIANIDSKKISSPDILSKITENIFKNRSTRIAVLHTNKDYRSYLCALLESHYYSVLEAEDAAELFEYMMLYPSIQIALLEEKESDINTLTKLRRLRTREKLSIIALTTQRESDVIKRLFESGVNDVITTSTDDMELMARIKSQAHQISRSQNQELNVYLDEQTGVHTSGYFFDVGNRIYSIAQRNGLKVGFAVINIDNFSRLNETRGAAVGDHVLKSVARKLDTSTRTSDIVSRWQGDEFLCFISLSDESDIKESFERICAEIEEKGIWFANKKIPVTISVGVTSNVGSGFESMQVLANTALFQAKKAGGSRVVQLN